jgi:hypothetical protein
MGYTDTLVAISIELYELEKKYKDDPLQLKVIANLAKEFNSAARLEAQLFGESTVKISPTESVTTYVPFNTNIDIEKLKKLTIVLKDYISKDNMKNLETHLQKL